MASTMSAASEQAPDANAAHDPDFQVYSNGLMHCSACTTLSPGEALLRVNQVNPAGTTHGWQLTESHFRTGEPNPCPCNDRPDTRKHFLFTC